MSLSTTPIYFDHFPSLLSPMWPPLLSLMWPKFQLPLYISTTSLSPLFSPVSSLLSLMWPKFRLPLYISTTSLSPLTSPLLLEISATPIYFNHFPSLLSLLSSSKFRLPLYISTTSPLSSLLSLMWPPLLSPLSSPLDPVIICFSCFV